MPSVSIRMKKTSNVSGRVAHDFRKRTPGYVDEERRNLNVTLTGQPVEQDTLRKQLDQAHREKNGKARRKDSALIWEGIITFSADADLTNREAFDQAAINLLNEIAEQHGFKEPLWLVRHEDESRPHYHFAFANAHAETAKPVRMSPGDMRQLQDMAGQCFRHLGLSRGKSKELRIMDDEPAHKWINRSVQQLHNDLPEEIEALRRRIAELQEKERKNAERLEKTLQKLQEAEEENEKLKKRAEAYQARLEKTQKELKKLQSEVERLHLLRQQLEQETQEANPVIEAIQQASEQHWLATAKLKDDLGYYKINKWTPEDGPPKIIRYNATLIDFESKLVAIGDGTPIQQAAALYAASKDKGWEKAIFSGMDEEQIAWLVEAAEKDGYSIDFEEQWAKAYAEEVREEISHKQRSMGWELEM